MRINNSFNNFAMQNLHSLLLQRSSMQTINASGRNFFSPIDDKSSNPFLNADSFQYVKNIKSASADLSGSLKSLSRDAFAGRVASSSDNTAVKASFSGRDSSPLRSVSVSVDRLATTQANEGLSMQSKDAYAGASGTQRFSIETGGVSTEISFEIQDGDTNKDVQDKMAAAINKAGVGVSASVSTNTETGQSSIKLETNNTGERSAFSISDTGSGNVVSATGAGTETRQAEDAVYSVNGRQSTSASNTVDLGSGLSATFNATTKEAVTVSVGTDQNRAKSAIEDMVKSYNELYTSALANSTDPRAERLASGLLRSAKTYMGSLSGIGIGFDATGRMTIDSSKMDTAADSGRLERFFTENSGRNYGFTNQLQRTADNISRNPSGFVSNPAFDKGFGGGGMYNSFGSTAIPTLFNSGWLFDFMM